nr:guanylate-binding protein 4-like [Tanacetum cinerariifolium]
MDYVMVSMRPTADGRVSTDANHEFVDEIVMADKINTELAIMGKHGINVMMVPRFSSESNVTEVEERIKIDDVMEVDTLEEAVQKALGAFNSMVLGTVSVRQRCQNRLHTFLRKELEVALMPKYLLSS